MKTTYSFSYTASFCVENARELGIPAALLLDKIVKLCKCTTRTDGFCWYTAKQFEEDTSLKEDAFLRAAHLLEEKGIVERKVTYIVGTMRRATHFRLKMDDESSNGKCLNHAQTGFHEPCSKPVSVNTTNNTTNMRSPANAGSRVIKEEIEQEENEAQQDLAMQESSPFDEETKFVAVGPASGNKANAKAGVILRKFGEIVGIPVTGNRNKEVHRIKQLLNDGKMEEDILWLAEWTKSDEFYKDASLMSRLSADACDRAELEKNKKEGSKLTW